MGTSGALVLELGRESSEDADRWVAFRLCHCGAADKQEGWACSPFPSPTPFKTWPHCVVQLGLALLGSSNPPASVP